MILGIDAYRKAKASTIFMGAFDGFHVAHQELAKQAEFMLTFDPHPKHVLFPDCRIERLTFPDEQRYFFPNQLVVPFSLAVANMSPHEFLNQIIQPLSVKKIAIGYDFKFGKLGQGHAQTLINWGNQNNCQIFVLPIQRFNAEVPYKSSVIRRLLKTDPNGAFKMLGHDYLIKGTVIAGQKKGQRLGFPTANLMALPNKCLPRYGVYASQVVLDGIEYPAITNVGLRPTFKGQVPWVESHILNGFSESLYHKNINVLLSHFIRDEQGFNSEQELRHQIQADIHAVQLHHAG